MDMNKQYAFWNSKEIYSYNEHTKLIIDQNTKKLYIKKTMGSEGYEIHRKICGIHHKNIAEIYDCVTDGRQCIVIEQFVSGETLETLCERQLFTEEKAVDVILQICSGLEQLHSRNIIHRDVTPSNIVLTDDGTIKLIDFDISRTAKSHVRQSTSLRGKAHNSRNTPLLVFSFAHSCHSIHHPQYGACMRSYFMSLKSWSFLDSPWMSVRWRPSGEMSHRYG